MAATAWDEASVLFWGGMGDLNGLFQVPWNTIQPEDDCPLFQCSYSVNNSGMFSSAGTLALLFSLCNYGDLYLYNLEEMSFQHENLHCGVWKSCSSLAVWSLENSTLTFKWSVKIIGCCWSSKLRMWIFYKGHFASSKKESWAFENPKLNLAGSAKPVNINEKDYEKNYRGSIARYAIVAWNESIWKKVS